MLNLLTAPVPNGSQQFPQAAQMIFVNGQLNPAITMRPGQVQLWRILNACAQVGVGWARMDGFAWRQTAQDGIQFCWNNFDSPANVNPRVSAA